MRLMIIGHLEGYISAAGKIALQRGAKVIHCEDTEQALGALRNGKGADLVMIDVKQKIGEFIEALKLERIHVPVVACGIGTDARAAVKAIQEGAKEYVPLPPDADSERKGLLVRSVRLWTAVAAVPAEQCTPELQEVLRTAARAALAAYAPQSIGAGERRHRHARRSA